MQRSSHQRLLHQHEHHVHAVQETRQPGKDAKQRSLDHPTHYCITEQQTIMTKMNVWRCAYWGHSILSTEACNSTGQANNEVIVCIVLCCIAENKLLFVGGCLRCQLKCYAVVAKTGDRQWVCVMRQGCIVKCVWNAVLLVMLLWSVLCVCAAKSVYKGRVLQHSRYA